MTEDEDGATSLDAGAVRLNAQALKWCVEVAGERDCPGQKELKVLKAFEKEKPSLVVLPDNPYPCFERKEVQVGKLRMRDLI